MSMDLTRLHHVHQLATEVAKLCDQVAADINRQHQEQNRKLINAGVELSPLNAPAPSPSLITGTRTSGELRRRSLDLTRALSDLRRP
jgi:hypothetical protein